MDGPNTNTQKEAPKHIVLAQQMVHDIFTFPHREQVEMFNHIRTQLFEHRKQSQAGMEKELAYQSDELDYHKKGTESILSAI